MLQAELQRPGPTLSLLLRYAQALTAHIAQTVLCNRYHSIDQQLCRRLLLGLDRSRSDELAMTQESEASLLGVRREGVTTAALKLQRAGVIRYRRGQICVLDRERLEQRACECYASARKEHKRLLPRPQLLPALLPRAPPQPGDLNTLHPLCTLADGQARREHADCNPSLPLRPSLRCAQVGAAVVAGSHLTGEPLGQRPEPPDRAAPAAGAAAAAGTV